MDYNVTLTEAEEIALNSLGISDISVGIQKTISAIAEKQINEICIFYVLDKLESDQRIGFTNKNDIVISANNEGYMQTIIEFQNKLKSSRLNSGLPFRQT